MEALAHIRAQEQVLEELQTKLQSKVEQLPEQVERLIEANRALEKELAELKRQHLLGSLDDLLARAEQVGNAFLLVAEVEADNPEELRELGDRIRDRLDPVAILLGAKSSGKVLFLSMVSKSLTQAGVHAGQVVKKAAQICGGGGGGRPDMAQAGGRLPEKLAEALEESRKNLLELLEGIVG